jgi:hypothetical protein
VGFEVITGKRPDWYKWFARKYQVAGPHPSLEALARGAADTMATPADVPVDRGLCTKARHPGSGD